MIKLLFFLFSEKLQGRSSKSYFLNYKVEVISPFFLNYKVEVISPSFLYYKVEVISPIS